MSSPRSARTALALVVLCLLVSSHGASGEKIPITTASQASREEFLAGRTLVDNLRLGDATIHFQRSAEKDPGFALAYLYLAQTAPTASAFLENLDRALARAPMASPGEQLWIAGFRLGALGDLDGQRIQYRKLVEAYPDDERAQMLLGTSFLARQEYDQAVTYLNRAVEIDPGFAPAYNQLGYALRFLGRYRESEDTFRRYISLIPDDPNPYDSYAELLLKLGRFDEAIAQYRHALQLNPHFSNSFTGIATALAYEGKPADARRELQQALAVARNDGERRLAIFTTVLTFVDEGKTDAALAELEKQYAIAREVHDVANIAADELAQGNILLDAGRFAEAMECFQRSLDRIESSTLGRELKENARSLHHYNVARVALARGDLATASTEARELLQTAESRKNILQIRLGHEVMGSISLARADHAHAIEELTQANQQNPYNLYRLALAYRGARMQEKARETMKAAAEFNSLLQLNYALVRQKARQALAGL